MVAFTILTIVLAIYFAPTTIIAVQRRHHNALAIFALNVLLGWTLLGWAGALVWALFGEDEATAAPQR